MDLKSYFFNDIQYPKNYFKGGNDFYLIILVDIGIGFLLLVLGISLILEKVKPNHAYGFRTKKTLAHKKIWYQANKY